MSQPVGAHLVDRLDSRRAALVLDGGRALPIRVYALLLLREIHYNAISMNVFLLNKIIMRINVFIDIIIQC